MNNFSKMLFIMNALFRRLHYLVRMYSPEQKKVSNVINFTHLLFLLLSCIFAFGEMRHCKYPSEMLAARAQMLPSNKFSPKITFKAKLFNRIRFIPQLKSFQWVFQFIRAERCRRVFGKLTFLERVIIIFALKMTYD